jgi:hypothetical protein
MKMPKSVWQNWVLNNAIRNTLSVPKSKTVNHSVHREIRKQKCWAIFMATEKTKLWSIHDPLFCLSSGKVDHSKSDFYMNTSGLTPGVKGAYHELWKRIGEPEGQIIWCYTCDCVLPRTGTPKVLWTLEVPEDQITCRIDEYVWHKIIGQPWSQPPRCRSRCETLRGKCDQLLRACEHGRPITNDWWNKLIVPDGTSGFILSALVHHPVSVSWVTGNDEW